MNVRESAVFAVRGVVANKLRSALTMSGILIGVAAVIILISAGTGATGSPVPADEVGWVSMG